MGLPTCFFCDETVNIIKCEKCDLVYYCKLHYPLHIIKVGSSTFSLFFNEYLISVYRGIQMMRVIVFPGKQSSEKVLVEWWLLPETLAVMKLFWWRILWHYHLHRSINPYSFNLLQLCTTMLVCLCLLMGFYSDLLGVYGIGENLFFFLTISYINVCLWYVLLLPDYFHLIHSFVTELSIKYVI